VLTLSSLPRDSVAIAMLEPGAAERGGGRLGRGAASLEFGGDLGAGDSDTGAFKIWAENATVE
jgi:hypothetical protein